MYLGTSCCFWRNEKQGFFHGHMKLWLAVLAGSIWHHSYGSGSVPRYLFKCLTYNMKREEQESMSARMHLLHLLLLWDSMNHTNLVVHWYTNKYVYAIFHGFFTIFLNSLSANPTKWSIALKQFVGYLSTNCLSVFDQFVKLVLKGLNSSGFSFQSVVSSRTLDCLLPNSSSFFVIQKSHMLKAILLQKSDFMPPTLLM